MWGLVLIDTGFARKFETLISLRVLLGVLEALIVPVNFLMLGMWYSRRHRYASIAQRHKWKRHMQASADLKTESRQSQQASYIRLVSAIHRPHRLRHQLHCFYRQVALFLLDHQCHDLCLGYLRCHISPIQPSKGQVYWRKAEGNRNWQSPRWPD